MNRKPLEGVLCLVPTVFDEKGNLDLEGFRENLRYLEAEGMHGIVAGASVGQYYELNGEEFRQVASAAREECHNMTCLIGTHFQDTRETIARTKYAEDIGADGAFILPAYYSNLLDAESCYAHYKAIHDATSEIWILLYNFHAAGFVVDIELWERLLKDCSRITAVKECTPLIEMSELARRYSDRLNIMSGCEHCFYPLMVMGGASTVGMWATAFPKFMLRFYDACVNKRWDEALEYHRLLCSYFYEMKAGGHPFDNKGIVTAAGLKGGFQKPPYANPSQRDIEFHKKWLKKLDEALERMGQLEKSKI